MGQNYNLQDTIRMFSRAAGVGRDIDITEELQNTTGDKSKEGLRGRVRITAISAGSAGEGCLAGSLAGGGP
jgi:hypothetical protein